MKRQNIRNVAIIAHVDHGADWPSRTIETLNAARPGSFNPENIGQAAGRLHRIHPPQRDTTLCSTAL